MSYVSFTNFSNRGLFVIFALTSMIKTNPRQLFVSHAHPSIFKVENCASFKFQQNRPCELALALYIINALLIHRKHKLVVSLDQILLVKAKMDILTLILADLTKYCQKENASETTIFSISNHAMSSTICD